MKRIVVLLPCHNESLTIGECVRRFREALPHARIIVIDNASNDNTAEVAIAAGAEVILERHLGKANAIRRGFSDIDADAYIVADGDATYPALAADGLVSALSQGADMAVARRIHDDARAFRLGHVWGNRLFSSIVASLFHSGLSDLFSGYRAFSRRFVKSFPSASAGFEIEAEMSIHALQLHMPIAEVSVRYFPRVDGSTSKLNTWRDGLRILLYVLRLFRLHRPQLLFGVIAGSLALVSTLFSLPLLRTYLETGLVPRMPTAVLSTGLMLVAGLSVVLGIVLDAIAQVQLDVRRIAYLSQPVEGERKGTSM